MGECGGLAAEGLVFTDEGPDRVGKGAGLIDKLHQEERPSNGFIHRLFKADRIFMRCDAELFNPALITITFKVVS